MIDKFLDDAEHVGDFEFGSRTDVTDPCYEKDVWCRMTVDTVPGEYLCYINYSDEGDWGKRVSAILIEHKKSYIPPAYGFFEKIGVIGVDAGLAGFFNNKPDYNDAAWVEQCNALQTANDNGMRYYFNEHGFFSDSGFGDGSYEVYGRLAKEGKYDALCIVFIDPRDEDEDYDDEE